MQLMRDVLRTSLGKSLAGLSPLDRLAAAWPVAAGHGIAERSSVTSLQDGVVTISVSDAGWQAQLRSMASQLMGDLQRISHVPLTDILVEAPAASAERAPHAAAAKPITLRKRR